MPLQKLQELLFTVGVTALSRLSLLRDRLDDFPPELEACSPVQVTEAHVACGRHRIATRYMRPGDAEPRAAVLLCHGIGEILEHWRGVQLTLASQGVASLVFDYAGYGTSSGFVQARSFGEHALAAFDQMRVLTPKDMPLSILGFSLGSGVACAIHGQLEIESLILCSAFTSFRDAARRMGLPARWAPEIWNNEAALRGTKKPVLILHGTEDKLFPVQMAEGLRDAAGPKARLVTVPRLAHDDPFRRPSATYWQTVASAACGEDLAPSSVR